MSPVGVSTYTTAGSVASGKSRMTNAALEFHGQAAAVQVQPAANPHPVRQRVPVGGCEAREPITVAGLRTLGGDVIIHRP
jgi:hypothetical protein